MKISLLLLVLISSPSFARHHKHRGKSSQIKNPTNDPNLPPNQQLQQETWSDYVNKNLLSWVFGDYREFTAAFQLKSEPNKEVRLDVNKLQSVLSNLVKMDVSGITLQTQDWWNLDIAMVGKKAHIDIIENAVNKGLFLKDFLGRLASVGEDGYRRYLDKQEDLNKKIEAERKEVRAVESNTKKVTIPGEGEEETTYIEVSLPLTCECYEHAKKAKSLSLLVSHVTALRASHIEVDGYYEFKVFATFQGKKEKIDEIRASYFKNHLGLLLNKELEQEQAQIWVGEDSPGMTPYHVQLHKHHNSKSSKNHLTFFGVPFYMIVSLILFTGGAWLLLTTICEKEAHEASIHYSPPQKNDN